MSKIMEDSDIQIVDVRGSHTDYIKQQVNQQTKLGVDDPLAIYDIDEVVERYRKWYKLLPRVELFYALKCNNDKNIVDILVTLGSSFDCASKGEIQQILELGVDPSRIIYANPIKQNTHLTYAKQHNVDLMTFDSEEELIKIKLLHGSARLLLRFRPTQKYEAHYDLGQKFGCNFNEARDLLISAKEIGLEIIGVSFHVGSDCLSTEAFSSSIKEARKIFDIGLQVGCAMKILDIGGGYRGRDVESPTIEENADIINQCLEEYFPETEGVKIIAEPGRYLVTSAASVAAHIIGRKLVYNKDRTNIEHVMYYINEGKYGSFCRIVTINDEFEMSPVTQQDDTRRYNSTVWGPTCAGSDCLTSEISLPLMEVGECLQIPYTGAYTFSRSTNFNSMPRPKFFYFCSRDIWEYMKTCLSIGDQSELMK